MIVAPLPSPARTHAHNCLPAHLHAHTPWGAQLTVLEGDTGEPSTLELEGPVAEVASVMRVSKMTVYRLVHAGDLAAVRVGRSFRVPERAVQDYLRDAYTDIA